MSALVHRLGVGMGQLVGDLGVQHPVDRAAAGAAGRTDGELGNFRSMHQSLLVGNMAVEDLVRDVLEHQPVGAAVRGVIVAGRPELVVPVVDGDADHVDAPLPGRQDGLVGPVGKDDVALLHLVEILLGPQGG